MMPKIAEKPDVLVVGGGPTGLAATLAATRTGADVTLIERDRRLGGILNQCVHDGFGLEWFGESLTGPEYAARLANDVEQSSVRVLCDSTVLSIDGQRSCAVLSPSGYHVMQPRSIVLAMGCRERSFGSLAVPGARPAGIFSAGSAQRLINIAGVMVGRRAVILGSGDIGLIMARRMVLEGAEVACVVERLPFASGLPRNVSQCLNDFGIPLLLTHTIVEVLGSRRLTGVVTAQVDAAGLALPDTRETIECDTLLVSVGLIPENELSRSAGVQIDPNTGGPVVDPTLMTTVPGVFACGNVLQVHDLADWASIEGKLAGEFAAAYAGNPWTPGRPLKIQAPESLKYVVPQYLTEGTAATLHFRVSEPMRGRRVAVSFDQTEVIAQRFPSLTPAALMRLDVPKVTEGTERVEIRVE